MKRLWSWIRSIGDDVRPDLVDHSRRPGVTYQGSQLQGEVVATLSGPIFQITKDGPGPKQSVVSGSGGDIIFGTYTGYRYDRFKFAKPLMVTHNQGRLTVTWDANKWRVLRQQVEHYSTNPRHTFDKLTYNLMVGRRKRQAQRDARIFI